MDCIHSVCTVSEYIHSIEIVYSLFDPSSAYNEWMYRPYIGFTHRTHTHSGYYKEENER